MLGRQASRAWLACLAVWAVYALWPSSVIRAYFDNGISQKLVTATGWLSDIAVQRLICNANLFGRGDNQCDLVARCQKSVRANELEQAILLAKLSLPHSLSLVCSSFLRLWLEVRFFFLSGFAANEQSFGRNRLWPYYIRSISLFLLLLPWALNHKLDVSFAGN